MELRFRRPRRLFVGYLHAVAPLLAYRFASAGVHVHQFRELARSRIHGFASAVRAQDALQHAVEVEVRVDAEGEAVLDGVDAPDVHGVVDGLDAVAQRVPRFAVMAARAEAVRLQLADADAHLLKMRLAIEAALVANGVDLGDDVAQFRMTREQFDELAHLIVEALAFRFVTRRVVEARLLAETRREDELELRGFGLKRSEAFVQAEEHVLGGDALKSRDLFRRIGRIAEQRELESQAADVRGAIETAGHVIRGIAMRFAAREDQFRQIENLQIAIEASALREPDQSVDVVHVADRQRVVAGDLRDLRLVQRAMRTFEERREARVDEVGGE